MRIQVNLSDELLGSLDKWSKRMGVTRSGLASVLIGQGIMSYEKGMEIATAYAEKLGEEALASLNGLKVSDK